MRTFVAVMFAGALLLVAVPRMAAQEEEEEEPQTHILTITTFKVPNGSATEGFWEYVDKYLVPSDRENPHILSERMGSHYWGDNEQNIWFIAEYEDLAALQAAEEWSEQYTEEHYPEGSAAADSADTAFEEKFLPYFADHRDNILTMNMRRVK